MYAISDLENAFQEQKSAQINKILEHLTLNQQTANHFLLRAASLGYLKVTKKLLAMGADVTLNNYAVFARAEENNHLKLFECLVSDQLDKNQLSRPIQLQLINRIAAHNRFKLSDLLDKLLGEHQKWTCTELEPLMCYACYMGRLNIVEKLCSRDVDVNALQGKPLLEAIRGNNPKIIRFLLSKGANPQINHDALIKQAAKIGLSIKWIKRIVGVSGDVTTDDSCILTPFILKGKKGVKSLFQLVKMGAHLLDNPNFYKILEIKDEHLMDKLLKEEQVALLPEDLKNKYCSKHYKGLINGIRWAITSQEYKILQKLLHYVKKEMIIEVDKARYPALFEYLTGKLPNRDMCEEKKCSQENALLDLIRHPSTNTEYAQSIGILYSQFSDYYTKVAAVESCVYYFNKQAFLALKLSGAEFAIVLQNFVIEEKTSELNRLFELMYDDTLSAIKGLGDMAKILTYSDDVDDDIAQKALEFANHHHYSEIALALLSIFDYSTDLLNDTASVFKNNLEIRNVVIEKMLSAKTMSTAPPLLLSNRTFINHSMTESCDNHCQEMDSRTIEHEEGNRPRRRVCFR